MGLFKKKEKKENKKTSKKFSPLNAVLKTILTEGDEEDYEYISKIAAKKFYEENSKYLDAAIEYNGDDFNVFIEFLNYFLQNHQLGEVQAVVNEDEEKIILYHYSSAFEEFEKQTFLNEFYKIVFTKLLDVEIKIKEEKDDEKVIFTIYN